jgi:Asp-tRNA(Asn)/Glu-tRNA(Gln) amidotransferase A subunit family amidase
VIHRLIEWVAEYIQGDKKFAEIFGQLPSISWDLHVTPHWMGLKLADEVAVSGKKSTHEYWQWTGQRDNYIIKFFKEVWEDKGFDFLICPVMAVPALEHGQTQYLSPLWYVLPVSCLSPRIS